MNSPDIFRRYIAWESILGAGIAATAATASAAIGAGSNIKMNKNQYKWWERQQEQNMANWRMQQEYNSPVNQMQRMREAGVNPLLVAGNVGNTASSAPATPPAPHEVPAIDAHTVNSIFNGAFGAYTDLMQMKRQFELADAQIKYWDELGKKAAADASKAEQDVAFKDTLNQINLLKLTGFRNYDYFGSIAQKAFQDYMNSVSYGNTLGLNNSWLAQTLPGRVAAVGISNRLNRARATSIENNNLWFDKTWDTRMSGLLKDNVIKDKIALMYDSNMSLNTLRGLNLGRDYDMKPIDRGIRILQGAMNFGGKFGYGKSSGGYRLGIGKSKLF